MNLTPKNSQTSLIIHRSELTWEYFVKKMAELQAQKRDDIPKETMVVWFKTFTAKEWTKEKFDKQFEKVLANPSYGAVKIDEFFNEEIYYTQEQLRKEIESKVDSIIRKGNKILAGSQIELNILEPTIDMDAVKLSIAKRISVYYGDEQRNRFNEIIDEIYPAVLEKLGYKKMTYDNQRVGGGTKMKVKFNW